MSQTQYLQVSEFSPNFEEIPEVAKKVDPYLKTLIESVFGKNIGGLGFRLNVNRQPTPQDGYDIPFPIFPSLKIEHQDRDDDEGFSNCEIGLKKE